MATSRPWMRLARPRRGPRCYYCRQVVQKTEANAGLRQPRAPRAGLKGIKGSDALLSIVTLMKPRCFELFAHQEAGVITHRGHPAPPRRALVPSAAPRTDRRQYRRPATHDDRPAAMHRPRARVVPLR